MHYLVGLLIAAAGAFWAFRYFVDAAHQSHEIVRDMKGLFRRGRWSRQVDGRLLERLDDPREAAAVLLYQVASYDGAVTDRQKAEMSAMMRKTFGADEETADGLYAFARMAIGQVNDAGNNLRKILRPVVETCTEDEKKSFVAMLLKAAELEDPLSDIQHRLIAEVRRVLEA